jgi:hypothetical protein
MKKIMFIVIFSIMSQFAFSQSEAIKFLSMGFNASESFDASGASEGKEYFFYGYDDYSEAMIYSTFARFSTKEEGCFFPQALIDYRLSDCGYHSYQGYYGIGYMGSFATGIKHGLEYKFEGKKLVYWALSGEDDYGNYKTHTILDNIFQNTNSITINIRNAWGVTGKFKYYNIPKKELLDLFLNKYIELVCYYINEVAGYEYKIFDDFLYDINENYYIKIFLGGRTSKELAIFRNTLFALKGYKFSTKSWTDFYNKYLAGYNGRYTNNEVMAMLNEREKWLLDLILEYENGK